MKFVWFGLLIAYCGLIFYMSHQPAIPAPLLFPHQDKVFHAAFYAVLGFFAVNAFKTLFITPSRLWVAAFIFCAFYGASDEWHQSFVPGRTPDILDWLADCAGALCAVFLYGYLSARNQITTYR